MTLTSRPLTSRLRQAELTVEKLQALLDANGYAYVDHVPDDFDHVEFLSRLGPLMPQYDGELIWSIQAQERFDNLYHSLNTKPLLPHTECYEFPTVPPKYLALWCLVPASDGGGQTTLADMYAFMDSLDPADRQLLSTKLFRFCSSDGVKDMDLGRVADEPFFLERPGQRPIVRFSRNNVDPAGDERLPVLQDLAVEFFDREHVAVDFESGAFLIWDNHRMTHSRTGYTDRRRHLRRVWLGEV